MVWFGDTCVTPVHMSGRMYSVLDTLFALSASDPRQTLEVPAMFSNVIASVKPTALHAPLEDMLLGEGSDC